MKKLIFLLPYLISFLGITQNNYEWVKLIKSQLGNVECKTVVADEVGNLYVCGGFEGQATFDTITRSSNGGFDLFVAKLDPNGNFKWVKTAGGNFEDKWNDLEYFDGHLYLTGYFSNQISYADTSYTSFGGSDFITSKIDTAGKIKWTKTGGSTGSTFPFLEDISYSIERNSFNEIYVSGRVLNTTVVFGDTTLVSGFSVRNILVRYDSSGQFIDLFITSGFANELEVEVDNLDRIVLPYSNFTANSTTNYFLTSVWNRNYIFQQSSINVGFSDDYTLEVTRNNDQLIGVGFQGSLFNFNNSSFASSGGTDFLLTRLDGNSQLKWIKQFGGGGNDRIQDIQSDSTGIYISGFFNTSAIFDTAAVSGFGQSFYIAKLDTNGKLIWVSTGGNGVGVNGNSIAVLGTEEAAITGDFLSQMVIDGITYNGAGFRDGYIAKLGCRPAQPNKIFGDTSVCLDTAKYYVEFNQGVTHTWQLDSGGSLLNNVGDTVFVAWSKPGNFSLKVTPSNTCGNGKDRELEIRVKPSLQTPIISGDTAICLGSRQFLIGNPEPALYNWQNSGNAIKINLGINALYTWSVPQKDTLIVAATNACGTVFSKPFYVDVASTPTQAPTIQGSSTVCAGTSVFTMQNKNVGESYVWNATGATVTANNDSAFVNFPASGNYSISAYAQNQCGNGPSGLFSVSVNDVPSQPIGFSGDISPCVGVENYAINPQLNTSYSWSFDSGGAIIPLGNSASVLWNKKGNYNISITPSNQCGVGQSLVQSVSVNAIPKTPDNVIGEDSVCLGSQQYLANLTEGTAIWNLSGGGALNTTSNVATVNWVSPGNYILSVAATNSCGTSASISKVIVVDTLSNALAVINGSSPACVGPTNYNVIFQNGQTYNWELDSGGVLSDSSNTATVIWQKQGFFNLKVSTGDGCKTAKVIEVIGLPDTLNNFVGDTLVCSGTNAYSFTPEAGINYSWQALGGGNIIALGASAFVTWSGAQLDTLEILGNNQCGSKKVATIPITIDQTPVLNTILGDSLICKNASIHYTTTADSGWSYNWQSSSGIISTSNNKATVNWIDTGIFILQVSASNFCGTSATISQTIEVLGQPTAPTQLIGDLNPCKGVENYSINGKLNQTYQWILGSGGQVSGNNITASINWNQQGLQNLVIIPQSICGSGTPANFNVFVNDVPDLPTYTTNTILCKGVANFSATANNADSIHWSSNKNFGLDTTGFSFAYSIPDTGLYNLTLIPKNVCGLGDTLVTSINVIDVITPESIIGDSSSCLNLSAYSANFDTALTYLWSLPGGGILNANQNGAQVQWLAQGVFNIGLRLQNKCGVGPLFSKTVQVLDVPPTPQFTLGDTLPCVGVEVFETFSSPNTTYNWSFDTLSLLDTTNIISINIQPQDTFNLQVYSQNSCGFSDTTILKVKAIDKPVLNSSINGDTILCFGISAPFSVNHNGDLLNWSINGGGFLNPNKDSVTVSPTAKGIYELSVATLNKCGIGERDTISIQIKDLPSQPGSFTGALKTCQSNVDSFFTVAPEADSLFWNLSGGGIITGSLNGAEVNWNNSGTFFLEATPINSCGIGNKRSTLIEVLERPDAPQLIIGDTIVCKGSIAYTASSNIKANYLWKTNAGASIFTIGNAAQINWDSVGFYKLKIISSNFCGIGDSSQFNIIVQDLPKTPSSIFGADSVCIGSDFQLAVDTQVANYQWALPSGGSIISFNDSVRIVWTTPGNHQLILIAENACGQSQGISKTIHVDGFPKPPFFSVENTKACVGVEFETFAIPSLGSNLVWFVEDGTFNSIGDTVVATWSTIGEKIINVFEENKCGKSAPASYTISVNEAPFISGNILGDDTVCIKTTNTYEIPLNSLTTYNWRISNKADFSILNNVAAITWDSVFTDTIFLSATNYCGTSNNVPYSVYIQSNPETPTISMAGDTLFASTQEGNLQWYFEGTPLSGAKGKSLIPQQQGYYTVGVSNSCEEVILSQKVLFGFDTETAGIRIYPNPTTNLVSVDIPINLNWEELQILNNLGQPVHIIQNSGFNLNTFDVSFISAGVYTVNIKTELGYKTIKLIKS